MPDRILSVFIDESGDFGAYEANAPYYIVSMVLHDQSVSIDKNIANFETHLTNLGYKQHAVHVGPLIRRESVYTNDYVEQRRRLFGALFNFARKLPFSYACAKVKKAECRDVIELTAKLSKEIARILRSHELLFNRYDKVIVYYDNGQVELTKILTSVFNTLYTHVEFRKVRPVDYKLFQVADLICSLELLEEKAASSRLSRSEMDFFDNVRAFKKNYYRPLQKKRLE